MRSNKPKAIRFQEWVCQDILPQLRKTGKYEMHNKKCIQLLNSQKSTCNMLLKHFPNDDIVKERVKNCLLNTLEETQINPNQTKFCDLTQILRDMNYPVYLKQPWDFTGLGQHVSKSYKSTYKKLPKKTSKYCNGSSRELNCS